MTYSNPKFRIIYHFMILSNFEREPNHQPTAVKEKTEKWGENGVTNTGHRPVPPGTGSTYSRFNPLPPPFHSRRFGIASEYRLKRLR